MKSLLSYLLVLPLATVCGVYASAQTEEMEEVEVNEVTIDIADDARSFRRAGRGALRSIVYNYMLENGDITQEELDALQAEREAIRAELDALRESGDEEALAARITELRENRAASREELREYVDANEDLAAAVEEQREQIQDRRRDRNGRRGSGGNDNEGGGD